jgi:hypothetical protein
VAKHETWTPDPAIYWIADAAKKSVDGKAALAYMWGEVKAPEKR